MIEGVDYAWSRPDPDGLYAAGKRFVCRYGGPGTDSKHLHIDEARALTAAGLAIVANAEGTPAGLLGGRDAGVDWARRADAHFQACGMPPDRPIYLSVDFDCTAAQWPAVAAALRGAASVIGRGRVGVYGSYDVMLWARRDNVAPWRWQTYAWSRSQWAPGNHIEQYRNGVELAGGAVDLDRALTADFGQWGIGRPQAADDKEAKMLTLIRYEHDAAVFLTDGIVARWVTTPEEIADVGTLSAIGRFNVPHGTDIQVVGRRELVGAIAGPCPPGWEAQRLVPELAPSGELPAQVDLSPAALAAVEGAAFRGAQRAEDE